MLSLRKAFLILLLAMILNPLSASSQSMRVGKRECRARTPQDASLFDAVRARNQLSVRRSLKQGANPNAKDDCEDSAVILAVNGAHTEILKLLIAAGANVNAIDDVYKQTPLMRALDSHDDDPETALALVKLLVEAGADINLKGKSDDTALMLAARDGNEEVVRLLIAAGADINAEDDEGFTAYTQASMFGHKAILALLISAGGIPIIGVEKYQKEFGEGALINAASDRRADIVEELLAAGTNVNSRNQAGVTALMRVTDEGTLNALLAAGADVNGKDDAGFTALMWAAASGDEALVKRLIAAGADVNAVNGVGETVLDVARPAVAATLIEAGAKYSKHINRLKAQAQ